LSGEISSFNKKKGKEKKVPSIYIEKFWNFVFLFLWGINIGFLLFFSVLFFTLVLFFFMFGKFCKKKT